MNIGDRFLVIVAIFVAATSGGEGTAWIAKALGAGDVVQAVMFLVGAIVMIPIYASAFRAYGRHGWRGEANNGR